MEVQRGVLNCESVVELALPAHLLSLMAIEVSKKGYTFRSDVFEYLNNAIASAFARLDVSVITMAATKTDETAVSLLSAVGSDNPHEALLTCCHFILKLVDEGLFPDVQNQAVLISIMLVEDAKEEGGVWVYNDALFAGKASRMLTRANLLGLYVKSLAPALPIA